MTNTKHLALTEPLERWSHWLMMKFLVYLFQEYDKEITEDLVAFWLEQLEDVSPKEAFAVARRLHKMETYGEPRVQNFFRCLEQKRAAELTAIRERRRAAAAQERRRAEAAIEQVTAEQRAKNLEVVRGWLRDLARITAVPDKLRTQEKKNAN